MPQVAPQLVVALSYNSTALNVSWQPIEQTRERVRGKLIGHRVNLSSIKKITGIVMLIYYFRSNIGKSITQKKMLFTTYQEPLDLGLLLLVSFLILNIT